MPSCQRPLNRSLFSLCVAACLLAGCGAHATPQVAPTATAIAALPTASPAAQPSATPIPPTPAATATAVDPPEQAAPTATPASTPTPPVQPGQPPHYELDVTLNYEGHRLSAVEQIAIWNETDDPWSEVVLSVPPAYWPGVWQLLSLEVATEQGRTSVAPTWQSTMMHVPLPEPLASGQALELSVAFALAPPQLDPLWWSPQGNVGWGERVIQVGDWYPALVPYRRGNGWLVWTYHPVGDPTINRLATYDVRITADSGVVVAAFGLQGREGNTWRFHADHSRGFAFLASPEYELLETDVEGIPVRSYFLAGNEQEGQIALDMTAQALALFAGLYGPYPYPELIIAQNGFYGSMEYSGLISQSGYAYEHYEDEAKTLIVSLAAHETGHQWWYGAVGNDQVHEPWLDEGLATYGELLFYERLYPDQVDWWWSVRADRWQPSEAVDTTIYDYEASRAYMTNVYGHGAYLMADLRKVLGDERFFAFLQDYYASNKWRLVTASDWVAALCAHADAGSVLAVNMIMDQYFAHPQHCE
jgi:hypothetical protein